MVKRDGPLGRHQDLGPVAGSSPDSGIEGEKGGFQSTLWVPNRGLRIIPSDAPSRLRLSPRSYKL
jgi:hypothetical protein